MRGNGRDGVAVVCQVLSEDMLAKASRIEIEMSQVEEMRWTECSECCFFRLGRRNATPW